jgi:hypothetical protein
MKTGARGPALAPRAVGQCRREAGGDGLGGLSPQADDFGAHELRRLLDPGLLRVGTPEPGEPSRVRNRRGTTLTVGRTLVLLGQGPRRQRFRQTRPPPAACESAKRSRKAIPPRLRPGPPGRSRKRGQQHALRLGGLRAVCVIGLMISLVYASRAPDSTLHHLRNAEHRVRPIRPSTPSAPACCWRQRSPSPAVSSSPLAPYAPTTHFIVRTRATERVAAA